MAHGVAARGPGDGPGAGAIALFVVWATSQAGYPLTHWAPGALIVLALLAIALLAVPLRSAEIPLTVKLALACLAAYTALSFLSILWAAVPGDAWEGANRTLLYLMVFALFALWRARGASAALLRGPVDARDDRARRVCGGAPGHLHRQELRSVCS